MKSFSTVRMPLSGCLLGLILVKGLLFILLLPPWQGPDEAARLEPAIVVARRGIQSSGMIPDLEFQGDTVASMRVFRAWDFYERKTPSPEANDFNTANLPAGASFLYEPPLSYLPAALLIRWWEPRSALSAMYVARLASLILHLMATLMVAVMGALIFIGPSAALLTTGLVLIYGLHPQLSFIAAAVHPDNFGFLLGAMVVALLLLVAKRARTPGFSLRWLGPLTLMLALAAFAAQIVRKLLILAPFLVIVLPMIFWPRIRNAGKMEGIARIAWIFLMAAILLGITLYLHPESAGSRLHWSPLISRADELKQTGVFGGWIRYAGILYTTFWMALGSLVHKLSPSWLVLLTLGMAWSGWGWLNKLKYNGAWQLKPCSISRLQLILLGLWLVCVGTSVLAAYGHPASNVEGRYLLLALPSIVVFWITGLAHAQKKDRELNPVLTGTVLFLLLNLIVIFEYLIPIYYLAG